ncbi:hypothetical protein IG193_08245 [Infirmifilum lucidum]|uniref:4Fe-4S ferredoxin-type domain-containing protein n=1 Tax=Infirmifilum lucidum TaxID=2776706 RepID=A0A7L9FIW1_9CREN|nr:hypothetical protein [Infirmifilum lucidum]QOJ78725.1 hypothetical protein IG193_08245 [Infirmifilum lucidum]
MVSLATLKAVRLTPTLVVRFMLLPLHRVRNPCLYCPGICLTACPTFLASGNLAMSPLGYSRNINLGREKCVKCWRCVRECPLGYPLPETFHDTPIKLTLSIAKEGKPTLVVSEGLEESIGTKLAEKYGLGLAVVRGITERYTEGRRVEISSLRKVLKTLRHRDPVAMSPEVAHSLGIPFLLEMPELLKPVSFTGRVHVPCLILDKGERVLRSLEKVNINVTEVVVDKCIKVSSVEPDTLYLCPRATLHNAKTIFDLMLSDG